MKATIATPVLFGALGLMGFTVASAQEPKPQNLPYVAVHNPEFIAVRDATFMRPMTASSAS